MKIIGETKEGFIATITNEEILTCMQGSPYPYKKIKVGDDINLMEPYNFRNDIRSTLSALRKVAANSKGIIDAIVNGVNYCNKKE